MSLIIDASVATKWFNTEELSDRAVRVKDAYVRGDLELAAPDHIIYEVGNSIWKNTQLTDKDAESAINSFLRLGIQLFPPSMGRASRSMKIAKERKISFYDAAYLQLAEELNAALLTTDEKQSQAGRGLVKIVHLREVQA